MNLFKDWLPVLYIGLMGIVMGHGFKGSSLGIVITGSVVLLPVLLIGLYGIFRILEKTKP